MPAFKVRCMVAGEYNGVYYEPGQEFFLIDRKDPDTGQILQKAEESFAEFKNKKHGNLGWMQRIGAPKITETPEQRLEREAAEAQRKADMALAVGRGQDANDPSLVLNHQGQVAGKIRGGMGWDGSGKNPNDNPNAGITVSALMDAGHTQAEAEKLFADHVAKNNPNEARPSATAPAAPIVPAAPVASGRGRGGRASGAAREAVGAPAEPVAPSQSAAEVI